MATSNSHNPFRNFEPFLIGKYVKKNNIDIKRIKPSQIEQEIDFEKIADSAKDYLRPPFLYLLQDSILRKELPLDFKLKYPGPFRIAQSIYKSTNIFELLILMASHGMALSAIVIELKNIVKIPNLTPVNVHNTLYFYWYVYQDPKWDDTKLNRLINYLEKWKNESNIIFEVQRYLGQKVEEFEIEDRLNRDFEIDDLKKPILRNLRYGIHRKHKALINSDPIMIDTFGKSAQSDVKLLDSLGLTPPGRNLTDEHEKDLKPGETPDIIDPNTKNSDGK